ncbi:MAG: polymer-forming cytoskeletal protein [Candidatus Atribacteria bacterium]|nr:polymer-forming cytoskeletal protein [Candidatus Atribacteria bacterium]MCD6349225.1 polymer-forming cytoskeletal protein [Candidatus Atribacteria bacterium]
MLQARIDNLEALIKRWFEKREKNTSLEKALNSFVMDLFVPRGASLRGKIESQGLSRIEGELRGTLSCPVLYVTEGARVVAEAKCRLVYLAGSMRGIIRADYLYIPSGGEFQGDIFVRALWVETGGKFKGKVVIEDHGTSQGTEAQTGEAGPGNT